MSEQTGLIQTILLAVPLFGLAGSAIAFVVQQAADVKARRHERFFRYMELIDGEAPLVTRLAAIYQLREFKEHRDFLLRFLDRFEKSVEGSAADALSTEMRQTADTLRKN